MNRVVLISAGLALSLSLPGCDKASGPAESNAAASSASDPTEFAKVDADFLASLENKSFNTSKTYYAPDAVMVLPEMAPFKGSEAIGASYDEFAKDPAAKFEPSSEGTEVSGDLAYSRGTYKVSYTNPRTKAVENATGYYLVVYKKQPDGSWKIVQDISSPTPAS